MGGSLQNFSLGSHFLEPNAASTKFNVTKGQIVPLSLTKIEMKCSDQPLIFTKCSYWATEYAPKKKFNPLHVTF